MNIERWTRTCSLQIKMRKYIFYWVNVHVNAYWVSAFEHSLSWECVREVHFKASNAVAQPPFRIQFIEFWSFEIDIRFAKSTFFSFFFLLLLASKKRNGFISYKKIIVPNHTINQKFFRSQHFLELYKKITLFLLTLWFVFGWASFFVRNLNELQEH